MNENGLEELLALNVSALKSMERVKGIEPSSQAWEARILPLNHTRTGSRTFLPDVDSLGKRQEALIIACIAQPPHKGGTR